MSHVDQAHLAHLGWFIRERQLIRERRLDGQPRPWTDDAILRDNHFTNIRREHDTGTIFVEARLRSLPWPEALFLACAYRCLNRTDPFVRFILNDRKEWPERRTACLWLEHLDRRFEAGLPNFTKRHLTPSRAAYRQVVETLATETPYLPRSQSKAFDVLTSLPCVGNFLGWQILCDLVLTGHVDHDPEHVVVGDGAAFGLAVLGGLRMFSEYKHQSSRIRGRIDPRSTAAQSSCAAWLRYLRDTQAEWVRSTDGHLNLRTLEHALCEWTRYGVISARREEKLREPA